MPSKYALQHFSLYERSRPQHLSHAGEGEWTRTGIQGQVLRAFDWNGSLGALVRAPEGGAKIYLRPANREAWEAVPWPIADTTQDARTVRGSLFLSNKSGSFRTQAPEQPPVRLGEGVSNLVCGNNTAFGQIDDEIRRWNPSYGKWEPNVHWKENYWKENYQVSGDRLFSRTNAVLFEFRGGDFIDLRGTRAGVPADSPAAVWTDPENPKIILVAAATVLSWSNEDGASFHSATFRGYTVPVGRRHPRHDRGEIERTRQD